MRQSIANSILSTVKDLDKAGYVDKKTMREIGELCLPSVKDYTPEEIVSLREKYNISQAFMAKLFSVTASTVAQWEKGKKKPRGASKRVLCMLDQKGIKAFL